MTTDTPDVLALRDALEPCPFCGGRPVTACLNDDGDRWVVRCISCGAEGGWGKTATSAERYWSMRTPAAVRAETLAGAGVVESLRKHHRHTVRIVLMADDSVSLWCRSCDQYLLAATPPTPALTAARLAQMFHEAYERLAPDYGYKTREATAVPWPVPEPNYSLMVAVAGEVLAALATSPAPAAEDDR